MFKPGDTVKRSHSGNGAYGAKVGQVATVTRIEDEGRAMYVTYPGCSGQPRNGEEYWLMDRAELVESKPAEEATVRITIGGGLMLSLTNHNNLVVEDRINGKQLVSLGAFSKARAKALTEYINRLAIHVE